MRTYIIPLIALTLFLGHVWHMARVGGWSSLAETFRKSRAAKGKRFYFVSATMINTNNNSTSNFYYNGGLFVSVINEGMFLSVCPQYRFMHPPLYIPWSQIKSVDENRQGLYSLVQLGEQWPAINIRGKAGKYILQKYKAKQA